MPARKHGGHRLGAGRKPLEGTGTHVVAVTLLSRQITKVERWQEAHDLESFSAAVRAMIDVASASA